jgi:putative chitinase
MLTEAVLAQVCPRLPSSQRPRVVSALNAAFDGSTVTTPARLAAFLAQAAHESGEFRFWEEIWGPTVYQRRYEPPSPKATELGNTHPGDGFRYRGRGPFQLTGRANYRAAGDRLDLPLEADPDLVSETGIGCRTAVDFWDSRRLAPLADLETVDGFRVLTRRINTAAHALRAREDYHAVARAVLGLGELRARVS